MTEEEWLTCTDPAPMLEFLKGKASDRQLRLLAVACCRAVWDSLTHGRSRRAVEMAEQYADGLIDEAGLHRAHSMAADAVVSYHEVQFRGRRGPNRDGPSLAGWRLSFAADSAHTHKPFLIGRLRPLRHDPDLSLLAPRLIRDIFANPFRPVPLDPAWLTSTVVSLAEGVYADRAFDRLPVLADALEDAGCDKAEILAHCRGGGPHVRGCWVVDLVLGKV